MNETIGQRIKECRKKMGMTQEKLAELSYIPKSTLSAYERDLVDIKMGTIKELAKIFHTTAGYLIDGEKVEFDEDIMQVVMMLQEMPEELRKVAMEQVKVLVGEGRCGDR
jgi:transcriptional regulator with XRE-family HTH domain